jgi:hypothetical protein
MSEYDHYVTYRMATDQLNERVEQAERARLAGRRRRQRSRHAFAQRLHTIADRIDR